jgi:hypothetical protein
MDNGVKIGVMAAAAAVVAGSVYYMSSKGQTPSKWATVEQAPLKPLKDPKYGKNCYLT